jgi:hypothetical protein
MRNVSDKSCRENQNINLMVNFFAENCAVYDTMWKNMAQLDRPQMTMYGACTLHAG